MDSKNFLEMMSAILCKMLFFDDLLKNQYLFQILYTLINIKNCENVVKSGNFEKLLQWRAPFPEIQEVYKISCVKIFPNLLGSHYLFEILHTTLIVKNSENMIKSGCFEKPSQCRALPFLN